MTPDEHFAEANRLNELAGALILHGCTYEASWYLEAAACHALSDEGRTALLERARELRRAVLWKALLEWAPTKTQ